MYPSSLAANALGLVPRFVGANCHSRERGNPCACQRRFPLSTSSERERALLRRYGPYQGMLLFGGAQKVTKKAPAQTPRGLGWRHWFSLCMPAADGHRARPRVHPTRSASCLALLVDISPSSSSFPSPRPPRLRVRQCMCYPSFPLSTLPPRGNALCP